MKLVRLAMVLGLLPSASGTLTAAEAPPNIVFILADDLGKGDLGCYGQRDIRTPNIDRLAREGMLLTRHYSGNAVCAPSRCVLMTGLHPGHAFIRDNRQLVKGKPGQYPIPAETVTLPALLAKAGYAVGGFGKWGLGGVETTGGPLHHGFARFFGYNCQGVAHNHYPTHLWDNEREIALDNPAFSAHQELPAGLDPNDPASYRQFVGNDFAPDVIAKEALVFLRANKDRPFFLYFPSTIPHLALQAPDAAIKEYAGAFDDKPYTGDRRYLPQRTPRACYAAMISTLDDHVGQILRTLDELKLAERTIVIFTSDNGAAESGLGGGDTEYFASTAGRRDHKGSLYEGGICAPLLVRYPGIVSAGKRSDDVCGFEDWLPTLLELTGQTATMPPGIDGISIAGTLRGESTGGRPFLYREFPGSGGQQAVWWRQWKAVRQNLNKLTAGQRPVTELYDLDVDPKEKKDVAAEHPEIVAQLEQIMSEQHTPSEVFPLSSVDP